MYYNIILKVLFSSLAGALIGYNREKINRPAGIRTHALLALGASILTIISMETFYDPITHAGDPGRIAAQIVSGIGFLGAGTILKNGNKVKGLTTAATLWVSASIGMVIGAGEYFIGFISLLATLTILYINKFSKHFNDEVTLEVRLKENNDIKNILDIISQNEEIILKNIDFSQKNYGILLFNLKNTKDSNFSKLQKDIMYIKSIESVNIIEDN